MDAEDIFKRFIKNFPGMCKDVTSYKSFSTNGIEIKLTDETVMRFQITDDGFLFTKN